jgi:hypothetical protein
METSPVRRVQFRYLFSGVHLAVWIIALVGSRLAARGESHRTYEASSL